MELAGDVLSFNPYYQRPWRPVFNNMDEFWAVLRVYDGWYKMGLSDKEITERIRRKYVEPHNPPRPEKRPVRR